MGLSKAEVKLRRLLASMHNQENPRKLMHYVATAKDLLLVLTGESVDQSLPNITPEKAKEYVQKVDDFVEKINTLEIPDAWQSVKAASAETLEELAVKENRQIDEIHYQHVTRKSSLPEFGKRRVRSIYERKVDPGRHDPIVKLEAATHDVVKKHRLLQENITDEMVILTRQMKETSLSMERSLHESEKILDSTEQAVEHSLATTNRANVRATELSSRSFATGCATWLIIFAMLCTFIFMVAIIRVT